ncbi:MAG: hypothetical protein SCM11_17640 [Bacillota bacterium]|nr:hypothetical protein [Bacillota bacterium]
MAVSRKSSQSGKGVKAKKTGARIKQSGRSRSSKPSFFRALFDLLLISWFGRVLLVCLVMAAVLGINILISANQYDLFFILTGIELVLTALVFWLRLVLRRT